MNAKEVDLLSPSSRLWPMTRRAFLWRSALLGAGAGLANRAAAGTARVGIAGLGERGAGALLGCRALGGRATIAALADPAGAALAAAAGLLPKKEKPQLLRLDRELLDHPELDALVLALPPARQLELAAQACRRGKDVFLVPPLAAGAGELGELARLAERHGRRIEVGRAVELALTAPGVLSLVEDGTPSGAVERVEIRACFHSPSRSEPGPLLARLADELDFALCLCGGEIASRTSIGGAAFQPGTHLDYRLELGVGEDARRRVMLHLRAVHGSRDAKESRVLVAGPRGTAALETRARRLDDPADLAVFFAGGEEASPGLSARSLATLLGQLEPPGPAA